MNLYVESTYPGWTPKLRWSDVIKVDLQQYELSMASNQKIWKDATKPHVAKLTIGLQPSKSGRQSGNNQ